MRGGDYTLEVKIIQKFENKKKFKKKFIKFPFVAVGVTNPDKRGSSMWPRPLVPVRKPGLKGLTNRDKSPFFY